MYRSGFGQDRPTIKHGTTLTIQILKSTYIQHNYKAKKNTNIKARTVISCHRKNYNHTRS